MVLPCTVATTIEMDDVAPIEEDHICVRFIRKKHKCIMLFLMVLLVFGQIYQGIGQAYSGGSTIDLTPFGDLVKLLRDVLFNGTISLDLKDAVCKL